MREKQQIIYQGIPLTLSADFSAETLQARSEWHDIFKMMKGNLQPRILSKAFIQIQHKIKSFTDTQKLRIQKDKTSPITSTKEPYNKC